MKEDGKLLHKCRAIVEFIAQTSAESADSKPRLARLRNEDRK